MSRVDLWVDDRGAFDSIDLLVTEKELVFPTFSLALLGLVVDTHDQFTVQVSRTPERMYLLRLQTISARDSLHADLKRAIRIATEKRLIDEADELMADFEERLYDDIPS
jgi:hypothetical protein